MAVKLLQVLVLGVIAAAAVDDVPVRWVPPPRATLSCQVPDADRIPARRPPPPLEGEEPKKSKPYLWQRNGEDLKRYSESLEVRRKDPLTDGLYQCTVRHQGGTVLGYPINLKFAHIEKQFSVHPANATAQRGQPFALSCDISSGPPANISWFKDLEPLPDDRRYQLVNNQLIITEVTFSDAGLYRCKATNALVNKSRTSHAGRLQVEEPPVELPAAFLPVHHDFSVQVERGTRVVLACPLRGNPRPALIWEQTPPGRRTGELESTEELLVMPTIAEDQAGLYECRVVGHNHLVKRFNVTITSPVNITYPPESKQAVRASTVRFNCTASGVPAPNITWYKDGKLLKLQGNVNVVTSADDKKLQQLLIRSVTTDHAGVYQCFARNEVSVKSAWATLNVTGGEAAAPVDVRCWPTSAWDVALRWRNTTADVVAYTVHNTRTGTNDAALPDQPVQSPEALVNLKSSLTPYSFQVRAYLRSPTRTDKNTATVVSAMSESVICQGQGVPIKLSNIGNDQILVSWQEFFTEHPGVVEWILQHKAENSPNVQNITLDKDVYNYTLKISPSEPRQVRVLGTRTLPWLQQNLTLVPWMASSAAGHYPGLGDVLAVPEDVEVTEVNARNFTVRWRCEVKGLPNTYTFLVCTRKVGGNEDCIDSNENSARVVGLDPESLYEVRVATRLPGRALAGDFSTPIFITTWPEGKEDLRELMYKYIDATTIRVSWSSELKASIIRYTYEYDLPRTHWTVIDVYGNTVLLTDLDPTKEMNVIVEGREMFGQITIPAQIPEARDLRYTYTADGVMVSWKGRGPRVVRYSQNLTQPLTSWTTIDVDTDTSVQIRGLDPLLRTFVMVAAPGERSHSQVLTINPRPLPDPATTPADHYNLYLGIGIGCGILVLCAGAAVAVCAWRKRKEGRSPRRRAHAQPDEPAEEMALRSQNIGDRLANGGGSKDAGEPLLNGHVHITENPTQSKTPNGKVRRVQHYDDAFDVTRYDDADVTLETVLDGDTSASTTYNLLDTSRRPDCDPPDLPPNDSFNKLPDGNMNSELTRADIQLQNSKILPTLQPNG